MLSFKGLYEWKLTDKKGQIAKSGSQWNIVTDKVIEGAVNYYQSGYYGLYVIGMKILLSNGSINPSIEYREYGLSHDLLTPTILAEGAISNGIDDTLQKKWTQHNFPPPVAPRTITMIGISFEITSRPNFASFIELSVPITQDTDQYLYIKYTLFANYESGGLNVPANRYIDFHMNKNIIRGAPTMFCLGGPYAEPMSTRMTASITPFCQPTTLNNLMRNPHALYNTNGNASAEGVGVRLSRYISLALETTAISGVIGAICQAANHNLYIGVDYTYIRMCAGYSPIDKFTISEVSRVFAHPSNRLSQIFSDPAYPAESNGNITASGVPENKMPLITRLYITKTGDASDITNENVPLANIDYTNDRFTVSQVWGTGDKVRLEQTPL